MNLERFDFRKIVPCLDVKDGRLVKGINFVELKDLGDPAETGAAYSQAGADELVFLDISATLEGRKTMLDSVRRTIEAINIPLTVGGGISSCDDIEALMDISVSKISINSAAVKDPDFVKEASGSFGHHIITVAIDTKRSDKLPSGFEYVPISTGGDLTNADPESTGDPTTGSILFWGFPPPRPAIEMAPDPDNGVYTSKTHVFHLDGPPDYTGDRGYVWVTAQSADIGVVGNTEAFNVTAKAMKDGKLIAIVQAMVLYDSETGTVVIGSWQTLETLSGQ